MKLIKTLTITVFFAVFLIPFLLTDHQKDRVSPIDNRKLVEADWSLEDDDLAEQVESYLQDRIGFRNLLLTANQVANAYLFGKLEHPLYAFGKDGYVFFRFDSDYHWHKNDYIYLFADAMMVPQELCHQYGADFRIWINPSKEIVYQDCIPDGVNVDTFNTDLFLSILEERGVRYTYTADALISARKDLQVYNRQYDAGHWNDAGAWVGTKALLEDLQKDGFEIVNPDINDYYTVGEEKTSLMVSYFPIHELVEEWMPRNVEAVREKKSEQELAAVLDSEHPSCSCYVNPNRPDAPRLLLFHGSYMDNREKFLYNSFSVVLSIESYGNIQNIWKFFSRFEPDIVVFEVADYAIDDSLFPEEMLKGMMGE